MIKHPLIVVMLEVFLIAALSTSSTAQPSLSDAEVRTGIRCAGQYECVEYRPLTEVEARTSYGYPQPVQSQDGERFAATAARDICEACDLPRPQ
jgi:hypothetical protein